MESSNIIIHRSRIEHRADLAVCITPFLFNGETHELEFSVQSEFQDFLSDRADGPFLGLLMLGMLTGSDIHVEGPLSPRLYTAFSHAGQELIRVTIPELKRVRITADTLCKNPIRGEHVATAFSAGVDSFHTIKKFFYDNPPPGMKVSHLTFANVGAHLQLGSELHNRRYLKHLPFAQKNSLPYLSVDSNISKYYEGQIHILMTVTLLNAAAALSIQNNMAFYYFAGTIEYRGMSFRKGTDISNIEGALIPLLATESLDFIGVGGDVPRLEKTRDIAELPDAQAFLEVCPFEAGNCSKCYKCMRTLFSMELLGCLHQFKQVFNLERYYAEKQNYLYALFRPEKDSQLKDEILKYAKQSGYHFSWKTHILGRILGLKYIVYVLRKKLIRRIRKQSRQISKYSKIH